MAASSKFELHRQIGLYAATAITVGNIIGSGIFASPKTVATYLQSVPAVLLAWVIGGVLSVCGAFVLTELVVRHPKTGGLYVFIREGFGDAWAFTFGWANLWVIKPTVIAAIASVFATYSCAALGLGREPQFAVGCAAILLLTFVNWLGVKEGARTASLFTTLKVAGILALCVAAFVLPHPAPAPATSATAVPGMSLFQALALVMVSVLFAYDGWTDSTYVAGEIRDPQRSMPIAILGGTLLVVGIYVLTNLAYFSVMSAPEMVASEALGSDVMRRLVGEWGARALAVLVAVSTFGTTNGAILTGPRVTQAMAADGLLWKPLAALHPRRESPSLALWVQAVLSCVWLYFANGFEDVSGWFVTTSWLFYGVTTATIFTQRSREAKGEQGVASYRTPFYPLTPILFLLVTAVIIYSDFSSSPKFEGTWIPRAMAGVLIAATGFPVYWLWRGRKRA